MKHVLLEKWPHEVDGVYCGCLTETYLGSDGMIDRAVFHRCPKHTAADELYEAVKSRTNYEAARRLPLGKSGSFWFRYGKLIRGKEGAALALARSDVEVKNES